MTGGSSALSSPLIWLLEGSPSSPEASPDSVPVPCTGHIQRQMVQGWGKGHHMLNLPASDVCFKGLRLPWPRAVGREAGDCMHRVIPGPLTLGHINSSLMGSGRALSRVVNGWWDAWEIQGQVG